MVEESDTDRAKHIPDDCRKKGTNQSNDRAFRQQQPYNLPAPHPERSEDGKFPAATKDLDQQCVGDPDRGQDHRQDQNKIENQKPLDGVST